MAALTCLYTWASAQGYVAELEPAVELPEVHPLGARVYVTGQEYPPSEGAVTGVVGDGTRLDRHARWYWIRLADGTVVEVPAEQTRRIVQVTVPGGESFEGLITGASRDTQGAVIYYTVCYLHAQAVNVPAEPDWVTPL